MALLGLVFCPEAEGGYGNSARGFNPGNRPINGSALKGRQIGRNNNTRVKCSEKCLALCQTNASFILGSDRGGLVHVSSRPFRANGFIGWFPGLKPWAQSWSPFGATNRPKRFLSARHSGMA